MIARYSDVSEAASPNLDVGSFSLHTVFEIPACIRRITYGHSWTLLIACYLYVSQVASLSLFVIVLPVDK